MSDINFNATIGFDKDLRLSAIERKDISQETYYKATFSPIFPPIKKVQINQYTYASLVPDSISLLGRHRSDEDDYQFNIILRRGLADGTYKVTESGEYGVTASIMAAGKIIHGRNGHIRITRDPARESIDANFQYEITYEGTVYKVENGKLYLFATGPL